MRLLRRLLKTPTIHFLAFGALVFALVHANRRLSPGAGAVSRQIVIDGDGLEGDALDRAVEEEILVREALALGIDRGQRIVEARLTELGSFLELDGAAGNVAPDRPARELDFQRRDLIVRRHLATLMRMMLSRLAPADFPTDADLEAHLAANAAAFASPPRIRLTQIYLSRERHGDSLRDDAARLRRALVESGAGPQAAEDLGDPSADGARRMLASADELDRTFGPGFAAAIERCRAGTWCEPLESTYGAHLVWIHERLCGRIPKLDEVRSRVLHAVLAERRDARLRERLAALRARYQVRVARTSGDAVTDAP
jgi:PPIC-type PPIASE domain